MVGGTIIGLAVTGDEVLVNVRGSGCEKNDTIAVRCKHLDQPLAIGDSLWWQSGNCYWTPKANHGLTGKCGVDIDIALPKVGYSHAHAHV